MSSMTWAKTSDIVTGDQAGRGSPAKRYTESDPKQDGTPKLAKLDHSQQNSGKIVNRLLKPIEPTGSTMEEDGFVLEGRDDRVILGRRCGGLLQRKAADGQNSDEVTSFDALRVPSITVVGYIWLQRLEQRYKALRINSLNVHRLLITMIMVAAKYFDDRYYNNAYYAKVGGISKEEINHLELELLTLMRFDLWVSVDDFSKASNELLEQPDPE